jgi:DNA-binding PucR family transcriptional regulator
MALPARKADVLLRTLGSYLDHQGSVTETAQALFLHRNAVRYRLDQVKELLGSDLSDPDERLSLHLACRGWALTSSRPR